MFSAMKCWPTIWIALTLMQTLNETIKLLHYRLLVLECMTVLFIVDCVAKILLSLYYHKRFGYSVYIEWNCCYLDSLNEFDFKWSQHD